MERTDADSMKKAFEGQYYDVVIDKIAYCPNDIKYAMEALHFEKYIYMSSTSIYEPKHIAAILCRTYHKRDSNVY